jgi:hypothetical protein
MSNKITPESLIEMGFVDTSSPDDMIYNDYTYSIGNIKINVYGNNIVDLYLNGQWHDTNATTIEDIKDLIRLFK